MRGGEQPLSQSIDLVDEVKSRTQHTRGASRGGGRPTKPPTKWEQPTPAPPPPVTGIFLLSCFRVTAQAGH